MRACGVSSVDLETFALGDRRLEVHVEGCDDCLAFLAELWTGLALTDMAPPIVKRMGISG